MASDKIEKKRKRASDLHDRPTKKPALDLQNLPPLSASLITDDSELAPVLSTSHHTLPSKKNPRESRPLIVYSKHPRHNNAAENPSESVPENTQ